MNMHKDPNDNIAGDNSKVMMKDVNEDLQNTRNSVAELIRYSAAMMEAKEKGIDGNDVEKISEYKRKAIEAINSLFDEDLNP
jgi:hypothetical protein